MACEGIWVVLKIFGSVPGPIHILGRGKKFKAKCPLQRYMWSGKGHRPIHGN